MELVAGVTIRTRENQRQTPVDRISKVAQLATRPCTTSFTPFGYENV